jgi:GntR family transcriptional repressor for pyruvate dehydrogenase complex
MHPAPRKTLSADLAGSLIERIRSREFAPGHKLPTEQHIMQAHRVSRTVVREALSHLQAAGLVETRHGVGTFVRSPAEAPAFRVSPDQLGNLRDVIALLEFRIGVETESAALAAQRRREDNLVDMRRALDAFDRSLAQGRDAVGADFDFHREVARATRNHHFVDLISSLGLGVIPRRRLTSPDLLPPDREAYLQRVNLEHESIYNAIAAQDAEAARAAMRTHLSNSRDRLRREEQAGG